MEKIVFCEEVKRILRRPAGELVRGPPEKVADKIREAIERERPRVVVSVGDFTSKILRERGVRAKIYVIDGKTERREAAIFDTKGLKTVRVVNERGTLNPEAVKKLHEILGDPRAEDVAILVEGEEDLLALAAILSAPDGSFVIYGQPGEGNVIVRVNEESRRYAMNILELNERCSRGNRRP